MPELVPQLTFYVFAALILGSAILTITRRNAVTAALFLALCLLSVGGLFVSLKAEFLFAVQVMVYTGGVMVLFLFVIMLVNIEDLPRIRAAVRGWWLPAGLVVVSFFALGWHARQAQVGRLPGGFVEPAAGLLGNTRAVALALFTDYLLPFEIVSILLLVAMIGAIVLAKKEL